MGNVGPEWIFLCYFLTFITSMMGLIFIGMVRRVNMLESHLKESIKHHRLRSITGGRGR